MKLYYSATTGEFYDSHVHQTLPDDAVKIGDPNVILATRKYVDDTVQKNRDEIEQTVKEKYSGLRNMQVFDKDGEFTVPENCTRIKIRLWGGGGAGAFGSMSGAGGGYAEGFFTVVPGTSVNITVGAAGKARTNWKTGGTSKVGSLISATGGEGGSNRYNPHAGGVGQGGDWQVTGSTGQATTQRGGTGGAAYGSSGGIGLFGEGPPAMTPGGGGASGSNVNGKVQPGSDGGAGLVIIEY